jgi:hypothetical protein
LNDRYQGNEPVYDREAAHGAYCKNKALGPEWHLVKRKSLHLLSIGKRSWPKKGLLSK